MRKRITNHVIGETLQKKFREAKGRSALVEKIVPEQLKTNKKFILLALQKQQENYS